MELVSTEQCAKSNSGHHIDNSVSTDESNAGNSIIFFSITTIEFGYFQKVPNTRILLLSLTAVIRVGFNTRDKQKIIIK